MRLEGWHLIIIIVLALVLFAAPKLPSMARSIGQSMRIFKSEVREMKKDGSSEAKDSQDASDAVEGKVVATRTSRPRTTARLTYRPPTASKEKW